MPRRIDGDIPEHQSRGKRGRNKEERGDDGLYVGELGECPGADEGSVRETNRRIRRMLSGD